MWIVREKHSIDGSGANVKVCTVVSTKDQRTAEIQTEDYLTLLYDTIYDWKC